MGYRTPWLKGEHRQKQRELERDQSTARRPGPVIIRAPYLTVRTYDLLDLFGSRGDKISPQATASFFTMRFKRQVNILKVQQLIRETFDDVPLEAIL